MTDYDSIWRMQDEIRTVVNAVLGECIWDLRYNDRRIYIGQAFLLADSIFGLDYYIAKLKNTNVT